MFELRQYWVLCRYLGCVLVGPCIIGCGVWLTWSNQNLGHLVPLLVILVGFMPFCASLTYVFRGKLDESASERQKRLHTLYRWGTYSPVSYGVCAATILPALSFAICTDYRDKKNPRSSEIANVQQQFVELGVLIQNMLADDPQASIEGFCEGERMLCQELRYLRQYPERLRQEQRQKEIQEKAPAMAAYLSSVRSAQEVRESAGVATKSLPARV